MKRTLSIVAIVLIVVASSLVTVACSGGVSTEKEWNDAINYLNSCNTVTIDYEKKFYTNLHIKEENETWTVAYNGDTGVLHAVQVVKNFSASVLKQTTHHQIYAVVDSADIKYYTKDFVDSNYKNWSATVINCANEMEASAKLKELFVEYIARFGLDGLNYSEFTRKFSKFEKSEVVGKSDTVTQVTFSDGHISTVYNERKPQKGSDSIDTTKITITLQYSAEITTPNGLEYANWQ